MQKFDLLFYTKHLKPPKKAIYLRVIFSIKN